MSSPSLGRLQIVPPRVIWPHEAIDFTPWLLQNVDVLSDLLGMDLVLAAAEHCQVPSFVEAERVFNSQAAEAAGGCA